MGEVMVTGATGGIGRAVVTELAGAGHQVSAVGRSPGRLRQRAVGAGRAGPELSAAGVRRRSPGPGR